jgi:hypothetical protein
MFPMFMLRINKFYLLFDKILSFFIFIAFSASEAPVTDKCLLSVNTIKRYEINMVLYL